LSFRHDTLRLRHILRHAGFRFSLRLFRGWFSSLKIHMMTWWHTHTFSSYCHT
jgi:hypothetical protein